MPSKSKHGLSEINLGSDYTEPELEFMLAMDRYKRSHQRPYPSWREVLRVLHALGYRQVAKKCLE